MNLSPKMGHYLRAHIDFSTFYILGVLPQNSDEAVVLLAPRDVRKEIHFNLQYREHSAWYATIEAMLDCCVANHFMSRPAADRLAARYHKDTEKGGC